jgi:2-hydroxy-3-oxopropionate reductase
VEFRRLKKLLNSLTLHRVGSKGKGWMAINRVGVIGTGRIGNPMARNLAKANYSVYANDVRKEACQNLAEFGVNVVASAREVAENAEVILLSLMQTEVIEEVLFGKNGICQAAIGGKIIVDTSTSVPYKTAEYAGRLAEFGAALIDAPLTGGEAGAQAGTLTLFVGGNEEAFQQVKPVLDVLATHITYFGKAGSGHTVKLAHQMMMSCMFVSIAEAFAFIEKMGLDGVQVFEAVEHGGPESKILSGFGKQYARVMQGEVLPDDQHYPPIFAKDLRYALQESYQHNAYMPAAAAAEEVFKQALGAKVQGGSPILKLLALWRMFKR